MRDLVLMMALLLVFVAGCAVEPPDWTHGQASSYPAGEYLTAVGVDRARDLAEDKARQQLQEKFRWKPAEIGDDVEGVQIAEVWHDRKKDDFYALAVITRNLAGKPLADALVALNRSISEQVTAAESRDTTLLRWAHFLQAVSLTEKRAALAADLRRIDPAANLPATGYSLRQLTELRDQAAAGVGVEVRLSNDSGDAVKKSLVRAFAERGLRLVPDFAAGLRISGSVAEVAQTSSVRAVAARIMVEAAGAEVSTLPVIDEQADLATVGERLAVRVVTAITSMTQQRPL